MKFTNPEMVISPKVNIKEVRVLLNTGEGGWSLADLKWNDELVMGVRWNGEPDNPLGNPQSRGIATWFVLPDEIAQVLRTSLIAPKFSLADFPDEIKRVRLRPLPRRILQKQEQEKVDYIWSISEVDRENGKVHITNPSTGHYLVLYGAHIRSVVPDPFSDTPDGFKHGILDLTVQMVFEDGNVRLEYAGA